MMINHELSLIANSNTANGAKNKTPDGSLFNIYLTPPIKIPKEAKNIQIRCEQASIWYTMPNIITDDNDKLYIFGDREDGAPAQLFTLTIPQGLYDLKLLNPVVQNLLENAGAKTTPSPLISLTADYATNKVLFRYNYSNVYIDFSGVNTPRTILGMNPTQHGPYATAPANELASSIANFASIEYFLLHCTLTDEGIRENNIHDNIISQILVDKLPGRQLIHAPFNPPRSSASNLQGSSINSYTVWLTNNLNNPVNTNGEDFSARFVLSYQTNE
jgi:hypothetical protein